MLSRYWNRYAHLLAIIAASTIAGCAQLPWPGSSANSQPEAPPSDLANLQSIVAADHQAIQQLAERNRQLEEELTQLKERPAAPATGEVSEGRMAAINQRLTKLESTSSSVQNTLSRAIGRAIKPTTSPEEEPVPLPSYDALLDHEIGLTEGEHRQQLADQLYREGLVALRGFRWATAIDRFAQLEKRFPKAETIERARYFSAIAYYQDGKYERAVTKFHDFVARYPKSTLTSTAMLNLALTYVQIKDQIDARTTLKKVIADYPNTSEASVAQATLKNLEPGPAEARK